MQIIKGVQERPLAENYRLNGSKKPTNVAGRFEGIIASALYGVKLALDNGRCIERWQDPWIPGRQQPLPG